MSRITPDWKLEIDSAGYPGRARVTARGGCMVIYDAPLSAETEANAELIAAAPLGRALVDLILCQEADGIDRMEAIFEAATRFNAAAEGSGS